MPRQASTPKTTISYSLDTRTEVNDLGQTRRTSNERAHSQPDTCMHEYRDDEQSGPAYGINDVKALLFVFLKEAAHQCYWEGGITSGPSAVIGSELVCLSSIERVDVRLLNGHFIIVDSLIWTLGTAASNYWD